MEYIIVILAVIGAMYVGYAYGQEVIDEVNEVLGRVRAVFRCLKRCFGEIRFCFLQIFFFFIVTAHAVRACSFTIFDARIEWRTP